MTTRALSITQLIAVACCLSLVITLEVVAASGLFRVFMEGALPWTVGYLLAALFIGSAAAILSAVTMSANQQTLTTATTAAFAAMAFNAAISASHMVSPLPFYFYYLAILFAETLYTWCLTYIVINLLRIEGPWAKLPPMIAASCILLFGVGRFIGQSFLSLESMPFSLSLSRDLSLLLTPIVVLLACVVVKHLRLDSKSIRSSLILRLPSADMGHFAMQGFILATFGAGVSFGLMTLFPVLNLSPETQRLSVISLSFAGPLAITWHLLRALAREQNQGQVTAKLTTNSAQRFLLRHISDKPAWAAAMGLKTSSFHIDHDPGSFLHQELPTSIMQIRTEEIQRCVLEVLGPMHLHGQVIEHRVLGVIDPEVSLRPCIDALNMFACLYLDAGPLVERRIKGLAALLPIMDPGLAKILQLKDINSLIRRNLWFFHLDFSWIDQHMVHTPKSTRYDVRISNLSSKTQQTMMNHLEKTGSSGNFVWVGTEARERLLQEAPALRNIITPHPIPAEQSGDELLIFSIKFEQLIPRLQRYFDLDSVRKSLLDFEPSIESFKLQNLINLQIDRATTVDKIVDTLDAISSVPWRGFREKDNALALIIKTFQKLNDKLAEENSGSAGAAKTKAVHQKIIETIKVIGYPSQVLHNAQINKIALRDIEVLHSAASDPKHPRFQEAWLLLSTTDYERYTPQQRLMLLNLITSIKSRPLMAVMPLVQVKAINTWTCLSRAATKEEWPQITAALTSFAAWFSLYGAAPEVCCVLLDSFSYLQEHLQLQMKWSPELVRQFNSYFRSLEDQLGKSHPKMVALLSRWQEQLERYESKPSISAA